jgi:uncharacterized protein
LRLEKFIWIDADACPNVIKDIIFRASVRTQTKVKVVANMFIKIPNNLLTEFILVEKIMDAADSLIADSCEQGDIVITADVPLAALVVEKGALAINPRGEVYSPANIAERLSVRNFLQEMRGAGEITGGPSQFNDKDKMNFANSLDKLLMKLKARVAVKP